jgi:hypothetical protein
MLKTHDPTKLLSAMIIKKELDQMLPAEDSSKSIEYFSSRTIADVLKVSPMISRKSNKKSNMKITYGVMSGTEVIKRWSSGKLKKKMLNVSRKKLI